MRYRYSTKGGHGPDMRAALRFGSRLIGSLVPSRPCSTEYVHRRRENGPISGTSCLGRYGEPIARARMRQAHSPSTAGPEVFFRASLQHCWEAGAFQKEHGIVQMVLNSSPLRSSTRGLARPQTGFPTRLATLDHQQGGQGFSKQMPPRAFALVGLLPSLRALPFGMNHRP